jgi:hypothetical protein
MRIPDQEPSTKKRYEVVNALIEQLGIKHTERDHHGCCAGGQPKRPQNRAAVFLQNIIPAEPEPESS